MNKIQIKYLRKIVKDNDNARGLLMTITIDNPKKRQLMMTITTTNNLILLNVSI